MAYGRWRTALKMKMQSTIVVQTPRRAGAQSPGVAEVLEFPNDGNRYELVDGELLVDAGAPYPGFTGCVLCREHHAA